MELSNKRKRIQSDDCCMVEPDDGLTISPDLLACPECHQNPSKTATRNPDMPWALWLTCSNPRCHKIWGVCETCKLQKAYFLTCKVGKKHARNCHQGEEVSGTPNAAVDTTSSSANDWAIALPILDSLQCFRRKASLEYFKHQLRGGIGHKHLVGLSQFPKESTTNIDGEEADVILRITRHCFGLSRDQRSELACIFRKMERVFRKQFEAQDQAKETGQRDNPWPVDFPKTE